jgi:hypothetical protein
MQVPQVRTMTAEDLRRNMMRTYFTLRLGIVILSLVLPAVMYGYSLITHGRLVEGSISAFYSADGGAMRNWFVGILWAVGAFLLLYKGFSRLEDWLLNFAGVFMVLTAMTPCNCAVGEGPKSAPHLVYAVLFFACMSAVCLFCARNTITLLPPNRRAQFKSAYYILAILLFVMPLSAVTTAYLFGAQDYRTFILETVAIYVFVIYWCAKSIEFKITSAERRALLGGLKNVGGKIETEQPSDEKLQRLARS